MTASMTAPATRGTRRTRPGGDRSGRTVSGVETARSDAASVSRERRAAARVRDLTHLLQQRPELVGVHLPADLSVEAVCWCA